MNLLFFKLIEFGGKMNRICDWFVLEVLGIVNVLLMFVVIILWNFVEEDKNYVLIVDSIFLVKNF